MFRRIVEEYYILQKSDVILEIGIGNGFNVNDLYSRGFNISAFDISTIALDQLSNDILKYSTYDELPRNYFDIIMSFHVSEHMSPEMLKEQINVMLECLTSTGTYFMSFGITPDNDIHKNMFMEDKIKAGAVYYSLDEMKKLVEECKGKCEIFNIKDTAFGTKITKK